MTRFLIMLTCLFASATLSAALALFTGWPVALLAGGVAFLFTQHVTALFARRHDKRVAAREFAALRRMSLEFEQSLSATRHRMDEISTRFETQSDAQGRKIVSELRMLEGLMREFAGKVSRSARAQQNEIGPDFLVGVERSHAVRFVKGQKVHPLKRGFQHLSQFLGIFDNQDARDVGDRFIYVVSEFSSIAVTGNWGGFAVEIAHVFTRQCLCRVRALYHS